MKDNADLMALAAAGLVLFIPVFLIGYNYYLARKGQKKKDEYRKRRSRFKVIK